ncbi:MAG TPA: ImmA/IrrE family metallo-endopeptidase, partial [Pseudolabrys sp.]|nr:ImmA/IrrE family metallo-endopeptidase [Pseudolabrys sp.]
RKPTRTQLLKYASIYRRPVISFYLKSPPKKGERGHDFRTAAVAHATDRENGLLDALLRDITARQEMIVDLLESNQEAAERPFVGSAKIEDGSASLVSSIAKELQFDNTSKDARKGGVDGIFRDLRARAESIGVFVVIAGDLGSHHTALGTDLFRGFAIADKIAPFVVINDQDARSAWSFTLIHELAHVWLGQTGVSGETGANDPKTFEERIERYCDDVASQFLLPPEAVREKPTRTMDTPDAAASVIATFANQWCVSEPMVAYRFYRMSWISNNIYRELNAEYVRRWRASRQGEKEEAKEGETGPNYYVVRQHRLGSALIDLVRRNLRGDNITHTKAAKVLGIKPGIVEPLLRHFESARGIAAPGAGG